MSYVKVFDSILDSSLWGESATTRVVWITMLAMADRDGLVAARASGISHRARVPRPDCDAALQVLASPDPDSKSRELDGRRIVDVAGGWQIVNYERYRDTQSAEDIREKAAERKRRQRERDGREELGDDVTLGHARSHDVTPCHARSRPSHDVTLVTPSGLSSDQAQLRSDQPSTHPPTSTAVPVQQHAPPKEVDGWVGGDPPGGEPGPETVAMLGFLAGIGWCGRQTAAARLARVTQLVEEGMTMPDLEAIWRLARDQGKDPPALLARWLQDGGWRGVLADQALAAKEAAIRSRAPATTGHDIGRVYGEPAGSGPPDTNPTPARHSEPIQPLGFIAELAVVKALRDAEPEPEPLQEPALNPDSAWARRMRQWSAKHIRELAKEKP